MAGLSLIAGRKNLDSPSRNYSPSVLYNVLAWWGWPKARQFRVRPGLPNRDESSVGFVATVLLAPGRRAKVQLAARAGKRILTAKR
jgi:hypothetical protein